MLIFLHVPKSGGSTLQRILEREYRGRTILDTEPGEEAEAELAGMSEAERKAVALLKGHMHFGLHALFPKPVIYTTVLREPISRVVSHYHYVRRTPDHYLHARVMEGPLSLLGYAGSGLSDELENGQVRLLSRRARTLTACDQQCLDEAKQTLLDHFPVAGLTERFDESVLLMRRVFGWKMPLYVKKNVGERSQHAPTIDAKTRQAIEKHNELDMQLYEFASQRLEAQIAKLEPGFMSEVRRFQRLNAAAGLAVQTKARAYHAMSRRRLAGVRPGDVGPPACCPPRSR